MKKILFCAAAAAAMLVASAADATTYLATRAVGTGSVDLSITTDGTLGVIGDANIVDWDITVSDGLGTDFTIRGPGGVLNSSHLIGGTALTATASDLYFDYGGSGFALFQSPGVGSGQTFWCVQVSGCFDFAGPAEAVDPYTHFGFIREARSGNLIIASTGGGGGVPEPAAWALMIGGFAAAGGALRARRKVAAAA